MRLRPEQVDAWIDLVHADAAPEKRRSVRERLAAEFAAGSVHPGEFLVAAAPDGTLLAAQRSGWVAPGVQTLVGPFLAPGRPAAVGAGASLVAEAVAHARSVGATRILARPVEGRAPPAYLAALGAAGFVRGRARIEFRADLAALPGGEGSPLAWRTRAQVGAPFAAEMLRRVTAEDPYADPSEDPASAIEEMLGMPDMTHGEDAVQVGYLGEAPVAFLCAQANPSTGWARIAHMGLVPSARGRGLGRWVHRRGFDLMRAAGGRLYQGGTDAQNLPMLALFRRHGCRLHARMTDWIWRA